MEESGQLPAVAALPCVSWGQRVVNLSASQNSDEDESPCLHLVLNQLTRPQPVANRTYTCMMLHKDQWGGSKIFCFINNYFDICSYHELSFMNLSTWKFSSLSTSVMYHNVTYCRNAILKKIKESCASP